MTQCPLGAPPNDGRGDQCLGGDGSRPHWPRGWQGQAQEAARRPPPGRRPGTRAGSGAEVRAWDGIRAKVPGASKRSGPKGTQTTGDHGQPPQQRRGSPEATGWTQRRAGAARRVVPDPEIGVLPRGHPPPHTAGPDADLTPRPPVPPRPSLLLPQSRKNSSLLSGLDSTLSERSDIQLPKEPGASKGTLGVPAQTPACFIHSPPPAPPLRLPLPPCSPGHPRINCLMPPLRAPSGQAGEGWKSASHCPAGDLSPGTHPHPRPQPGEGWAQRGCSRRLGGESS